MAAHQQLPGDRRGHAGRPPREHIIRRPRAQRRRLRQGECASFLFRSCFLFLCLRVFDFFLGPHASNISVSDPHLDAKIFPIAHPYGTGSLNCESSSVHPQRFCRNRLLALQPFFRRSSRYAFWMLDMSIKRQLFFGNLYRGRRCPRNSASAEDDRFAQVFGTVVPHSIVESTSWWKRQSYDLVAICDDAESGRPSKSS